MNIRPFKSLAEQTRLRKMVDNGNFPADHFQSMLDASHGLDLPERVTKPVATKRSRRGPYPRRLSTSANHY